MPFTCDYTAAERSQVETMDFEFRVFRFSEDVYEKLLCQYVVCQHAPGDI